MSASTPGERYTATISTLVAVAILGAAVTAQQANAPAGDRLARLESDLRFQLEVAFNTDPDEHRERLVDLERALNAWRRSPQSPDDYRVLVIWFRDAIVSSMPGRVSKMPEMPTFSVPATQVAQAPPAAQREPLLPQAVPQPEPSLESAPPEPATPIHPVNNLPSDTPGDVDVATTTTSITPPDAPIARLPAATPTERPIVLAPAPTAEETRDAYRPQPVAATAEAAVKLNVTELNARIRGYHEGLADIEAAIVAGESAAPRLAEIVLRLERLAGQYYFVRLYYEALTPAERRAVPAPRSIGETVRLVQQSVDESDGDFLNEFDARQGEAPSLSDRLRAVAAAAHEAD